MNGKKTPSIAVKLGIDLIMTVMFFFCLGFRFTAETTHEWSGIALFVLFTVHAWINRRWYVNLFRGRYTFRRVINTAVNLALLCLMVLLAVGGMMNSRSVLALLELKGGMQYREWHTFAAYWGLALVGIHIGMHWAMISGLICKMTGNTLSHHFWRTVLRATALGVVICGVWASFDREMGSKLFMGFGFDYWDQERPASLFYGSAFCIMGLYVFVTHSAMRLAGKLAILVAPLADGRRAS